MSWPTWYCYDNQNSYSTAWVNVKDFYAYLFTPSGPGYNTTAANMTRGDVIQFYNNSWNVKDWSHCVIQTSVGDSIYYAAHTENRWNYALSNVYPTTKYTNIRFAKIE